MRKFLTTVYNPFFERLPEEFDGFTIAQVSDLHNANYKGKLEDLLQCITPDIIVITGDLIQKDNEYSNAICFAKNAAKIAPVFFVNGNHEARIEDYVKFKDLLKDAGIEILENETRTIRRGQNKIVLIGLNDQTFFEHSKALTRKDAFKNKLTEISEPLKNEFKVLLTHNPVFYDSFIENNIDLTLSGHTHGGQVRLPLIGAFFVPSMGFFPKYIDGMHKRNESYLVISRGLGTGRTPPRIFNFSELVLIRLNKGKSGI